MALSFSSFKNPWQNSIFINNKVAGIVLIFSFSKNNYSLYYSIYNSSQTFTQAFTLIPNSFQKVIVLVVSKNLHSFRKTIRAY